MNTEVFLREREKELACIYSICLLAASAPDPGAAAHGVARALCEAMSFPSRVRCRIDFFNELTGGRVAEGYGYEGLDVHVGDNLNGSREGLGDTRGEGFSLLFASMDKERADGWKGRIELSYSDSSLRFIPQEKSLLDSVLVVLASMLRTANLIERLKSAGERLEAKNTALREVLSTIENERIQISNTYRDRLAVDVLPLAERAADNSLSQARRDSYLALLVSEIRQQMTVIGKGPESASSLSPREREIAVQVRNGRTSKEIAELLGIAEATVERHRHNIRRKLRLVDKSVNLASHLSMAD
ncbi:MAG: LuxR C-terminal-related transcriptional regulator [Spirochaetia bacterium]|jgi:DNA-binding CsgD family transcriptional regulator|nr:LuxR C-terminal-related transcriptional regulator [Spirochaetia bacterium]